MGGEAKKNQVQNSFMNVGFARCWELGEGPPQNGGVPCDIVCSEHRVVGVGQLNITKSGRLRP